MDNLDIGDMVAPVWSAGLVVAALLLGVFLVIAFLIVAWRWRGHRGISGVDSLVGSKGTVKSVTRDGVIIHARSDDWWVLEAPANVHPGQNVEVVAVEGLRVRIRRLEAEDLANKKRGGKS